MEVPFFSWFAGILGLIYLVIVTFAIPITGPAVAFSLVVAGQLLISVFLEQFGWLNIPQQTFNWYRMGGMFFVIVGVILIRKT
jgi:transporter family-2 protein